MLNKMCLSLILLVVIISNFLLPSEASAQTPDFTAVALDEFGRPVDALKANPGDVVYIEIQGVVSPVAYLWGAVKVEVSSGQITSLEESYDWWHNGMGLWWTDASADPARGGAGAPYYYNHIHPEDNDVYKSEGSPWAAAYALNYPEPFLAGPSGSIYNPTDTSLPSSARFYYSGYLGDHSPTRPGIRLGVRLQNANPLTVKISNHTRFAFEWFNFEKTNEVALPIVPRENYQSVHTEGNNVWIQVSGPAEANVGDTVTVSVYGELLNDSGLYNGSLVRTDASGVTSDLIRVDGVIGNEFGPETVSYEATAGGDETCTGTMQDIGSTPEGEPQSVDLGCTTIPFRLDSTPPVTGPSVNPAPKQGWNRTNVTIILSAGDPLGPPPDTYASGVAATYLFVDGNQVGGTTVTLRDNGIFNIEYFSVDNAGNEEEKQQLTIKIDKIAPDVTHEMYPPKPNDAGWYKIPPAVIFYATDNLSGVDRYEPKKSHQFPEGKNQQFTCRVYDKAGNYATDRVQNINVDWTEPYFTELPDDITVEQSGLQGTPSDDPDISQFLNRAKAKDQPELSGLDYVGPLSYPPVFSLGNNSVVFIATDKAGNWVVDTRSVTVQDTKPPIITPPDDITVVATATKDGIPGVPVNHPEIEAFLNAAIAYDVCEGDIKPTNNAPGFFFIGETAVTFNAVDSLGHPAEAVTAKVIVIKVQILEPDEQPVTDNNFTFDSSKKGVCTVIGVGTANYGEITPKLLWSIGEIGGSKPRSKPGNRKGPDIQFTFTGLPSSNSQFGNKDLMVEYPPLASKGARDNQTVQIFFSRDAKNNPGKKTPNWYYYWSQITGANDLAYGGATHSIYGSIFGYYDYNGSEGYLNKCIIYNRVVTFNNPTGPQGDAGIDCFGQTVNHERRHRVQFYAGFTDTTGDGVPDYDITQDADLDWLSNSYETARGFNPNNPDTNGDGIADLEEEP
ncbi:MAG: hypothetical protein AB1599_07915, partial [Planctomycetota bacterium]